MYIYDEPFQENVTTGVVKAVSKYFNKNTSYILHNISTLPSTLAEFVKNLTAWACRQ
jgi:hypothetical protein